MPYMSGSRQQDTLFWQASLPEIYDDTPKFPPVPSAPSRPCSSFARRYQVLEGLDVL